MNKKIGCSTLATLVLGSLFLSFDSQSQVPTTSPSVQITPLPVQTTLRDKTNANNYAVVGTDGALKVAIGGASSSIVTTTNTDLTALLAYFISLKDTNAYSLLTNGIRVINAGYVPGNNAISIYDIAPSLPTTYGGDGTAILIPAYSTNYTSEWLDVKAWNAFSFQISTPAAATTNEIIYIDGTLNSGTNWFVLSTNTMATTNSVLVQLEGKIQKLRARQLSTGTVFSVEAFLGYK